ncbi:MAG: class I SAM-dependent methyltransferase [Firmicutes bacterium]|nr:class I SAM-dependent methyltransferase [Bacillota bacterium]
MPRLWPGMLEAYSVLARFYDLCMEVDYGEWVSYLLALCRLHGHDPGSIIDLGCGTGNLTLPLAEAGYSLVGVDQSRAMIAEAQGKAAERRLEIPFYVADLREFSLPGRAFEIALSCCDVLNYLTEEDSLRKAFARVHQLLAPGGLWLFDLNSARKLQEVYGSNSYADLHDDFAFFWDNSFDQTAGICTMDLTFFVQVANGTYKRIAERHRQKLWLPEQIAKLCADTGFVLAGCYDFLTTKPPSSESERWQFVLKKQKAQGTQHA